MATDKDYNKMVISQKRVEIKQLQEEMQTYRNMREWDWVTENQNKINSLLGEISLLS